MTRLHLDPLGGIAGDMFVAALLHARPELEGDVAAAVRAATGSPIRLRPASDGALHGSAFAVGGSDDDAHDHAQPRHDHGRHDKGRHDHDHDPHDHDHGHDHVQAGRDPRFGHAPHDDGHTHVDHDHDDAQRDHRRAHRGRDHRADHAPHDRGDAQHDGHAHHTDWRVIRARLNDGRLEPPVAARATAIFALLADAEARVHGVAPDAVTFHEVGALDSIADIVAAATLLVRLDVSAASCAPVPLGHGRIRTAHGIMPVPAPATALLLEGLPTLQDGIGGERVTPTGAAILRHLRPGPPVAGTLLASGTGFGTRRLPGISNCLRVLLFAEGTAHAGAPHRRLAVISFEVDDQTGEDLATGIARLRATPGIHDVVQIPAIGKKGRFAVQLQVLADDEAAERAIEACFRETATIGLRVAHVDARALRRRIDTVPTEAGALRVKVADRPGGATAKAEADDLADHDAATRARLRAEAARRALGAGEDRS